MPSAVHAPTTLTIIGAGVLATHIVDGLQASCPDDFVIRLTTRRGEHTERLQTRYPGRFITTSNTDASL